MQTNTKLTLFLIYLLLALKHGYALKDIHIVGLFPFEGAWSGGQIALVGAEMAIRHINNKSDILPGYRLNLHWADTKCNPGFGVHEMYRLLREPPIKIFVLGGGCSIVTQPTAETSQYWNLVQISYASISPALSNKKRYPKFVRVAASQVGNNPARMELFKRYGWRRIATLTESAELFTAVADDMHARFHQNNITLISAELFTDDPSAQVENLKKHGARIIVVNCYEQRAVLVLCAAYKIGMYGHRIVWVFPGWFTPNWWHKHDPGCTVQELQEVVTGLFLTLNKAFINMTKVSSYGISMQDFRNEWHSIVNGSVPYSDVAAQSYDAIYVMADVLEKVENKLKSTGSNRTIADFTYDDDNMANLIFEYTRKVFFEGVLTTVFFNENGDIELKVGLYRFQDGNDMLIGIYDPVTDDIDWDSGTPITWKGGSPPADSTTVFLEPVLVSFYIYITIVVVASLGILLGLCFVGFNIKYRNLRIVKMSSPLVNNIIVLGCILVYSTVVFKETDTKSTLVMCQIRTFLLMVGFSMSFGALFAKTWRVHKIFTNKSMKKMMMKDYKLVLIVAGITGFDVILFMVFSVMDPKQVDIIDSQIQFEDNGNILRQSQVYVCASNMALHFDGIVYASKGLLLIFGTFLAWETRKVTIPALNDSQYIGMCIYNVAVLSIMGVVLSYALILNVTLHYILISAIIILGTTMTMVIIFVPKMLKLKGGMGDEETKTQLGTQVGTITSAESGDSHEKTQQEAQAEIAKLKAELDKVKNALKQKDIDY